MSKRFKFTKITQEDGETTYNIHTKDKMNYYCGYLFFDDCWIWDCDKESIVFDLEEIKELVEFIEKLPKLESCLDKK